MSKEKHRLPQTFGVMSKKSVYTLTALCGHSEEFDMREKKKWETGFVQYDDMVTCDECLKMIGIKALQDL